MITTRTGSLVALIATAALLSACGSTSTTSSSGHNRPEPAKYTQAQVYQALGVTEDAQGLSADDGACVASVVMTTPAEIKTYAGAGDPVATNPTGTVGVKVGTFQGVDSATCFDRFTGALKTLR